MLSLATMAVARPAPEAAALPKDTRAEAVICSARGDEKVLVLAAEDLVPLASCDLIKWAAR